MQDQRFSESVLRLGAANLKIAAHSMIKRTKLVFFICAFIPGVPIAPAQEPTATPDAQLRQLQAEYEREKLKADIATQRATQAAQQAAALKSAFPTTAVDNKLGTTDVSSNYDFPPQLLAYGAAEELVSDLTAEILPILQENHRRSSRPIQVLICQASASPNELRGVYRQVSAKINTIITMIGETQSELPEVNDAIAADPPEVAAQRFVEQARGGPTPGFRSIIAGVTAVTSVVQSVVQLISLFQSETKIVGTTVTLNSDAIAAQFGYSFRRMDPRIGIKYPFLLPSSSSGLVQQLTNLANKQQESWKTTSDIGKALFSLQGRQAIIEQRIHSALDPTPAPTTTAAPSTTSPTPTSSETPTKPKEEDSKKNDTILKTALALASANLQGYTGRLNAIKERLAALDTTANAIDTALQGVDGKSGVSALSVIAKNEALWNAMDNTDTYSVLISVAGGGGATKTSRNLFTGTHVTHLGGAILITTVTDSSGRVLFTKLSKGFLGYAKLKSLGGSINQDLPRHVESNKTPR